MNVTTRKFFKNFVRKKITDHFVLQLDRGLVGGKEISALLIFMRFLITQ